MVGTRKASNHRASLATRTSTTRLVGVDPLPRRPPTEVLRGPSGARARVCRYVPTWTPSCTLPKPWLARRLLSDKPCQAVTRFVILATSLVRHAACLVPDRHEACYTCARNAPSPGSTRAHAARAFAREHLRAKHGPVLAPEGPPGGGKKRGERRIITAFSMLFRYFGYFVTSCVSQRLLPVIPYTSLLSRAVVYSGIRVPGGVA